MRFFFWLMSVVVADQAWQTMAMTQVYALIALGILLVLSGAAAIQKATSLWIDRRRVAEAFAATPFAVKGVPLSGLKATQVGKGYIVVINKDGEQSILLTNGLTDPGAVTMGPEPEVTFDLQPSSGGPGMLIPLYTVTYPAGADTIEPTIDSGAL